MPTIFNYTENEPSLQLYILNNKKDFAAGIALFQKPIILKVLGSIDSIDGK